MSPSLALFPAVALRCAWAVLTHRVWRQCVMVDIDQLACEMCLKHLPEWADGCDKDSRFEVLMAARHARGSPAHALL